MFKKKTPPSNSENTASSTPGSSTAPANSTTPTPTSSTTSTTNQTSSSSSNTQIPLITTSAQNLLRIHIIKADLKKEYDSYITISIGKHSAKTRIIPRSATPMYDEHFVVEYETQDDRSEVQITVQDKGKLMDDIVGVYRVNIQQVDKPSENAPPKSKDKKQMKKKDEEKGLMSWYHMEPTPVKLTDKSGKNDRGTLYIRLRREVKVVGSLAIKVKEATINNSNEETKLIAKLDTQIQESEYVHGKKNKFKWKNNIFKFEVNETNNVVDLFIECWQNVTLIGETRITLFDAKRKAVKGPQKIESKVVKEKVGDMQLSSEFLDKNPYTTTTNTNTSTTPTTTTTTTTTPAKK